MVWFGYNTNTIHNSLCTNLKANENNCKTSIRSFIQQNNNKIETINRCERRNIKCFENIIKQHCVSMKCLFLNFLMFKLIFLVESNKYLIDQGCHGLTVRYDAEQHTVSISSSYSTLFDFTWLKHYFSLNIFIFSSRSFLIISVLYARIS